MNTAEYLTGFVLIALIAGGFWISARSLRRVLVGEWEGAPAVLAQLILALSTAIVTCELLGIVGLLNTPALVIAAVFPAIALTRWRPAAVESSTPPVPSIGRAAFAVAVAASLLTAIHWAGPVLKSLDVGIYRQDSLWYHLPTAAWFAQTGSVGGLLFTDPLKLAVWYYPDNSELLHSIGMVVLDNDLLSPLLNFGWMGVALLAAWCVGRPFGVAVTTLLAGILVVDSDMMLVQAGNAPSDIVALACLLASIAIFANGWAAYQAAAGERKLGIAIEPGALTVAALAAGLAIGTKVTLLIPVGVMTIAILAAGSAGLRQRAAIWLGGLFATGGFWYLRNLVHAGNPLPWINLGPLSGPHQEDLYPRPAHSVADYIADRHVWTDYFFPGLGETIGPLWPLVVFAALAGIILGLRRRQPRPVRVIALAAAATLIAYVFIPISASGGDGAPTGFASNLRYAAPVFAIGLILLPIVEARPMVRRALMPAYAVLVFVAAIGSEEWVQPQLAAAIAIGAVAVLLPVWLLSRGAPTGRAWVVVAAVLAAALVAGYAQQRQYFEDRYQPDVAPLLDNPGFRASEQWQAIQAWATEQHNLKIGIVGTPAAYGQYLFYGDDLSNEVRYLGEPRRHGGFGPVASCQKWNLGLLEGRFDAVIITPEDSVKALVPLPLTWTRISQVAVPVLEEPLAGVYLIARAPKLSRCLHRRGGEKAPQYLPPSTGGGQVFPGIYEGAPPSLPR